MRIYWITSYEDHILGIMPRPRGDDWLEDELKKLISMNVQVLVSALEKSEARELGLSKEKQLCEDLGIVFHEFPIPDMNVPDSKRKYDELISNIATELDTGNKTVIHCRMGIGRSSLIAIGVLMKQGVSLKKAIEVVSKSRGINVPESDAQLKFLEEIDSLYF